MLRAVGNNVLLKLPPSEQRTDGGLVLPYRNRYMVICEVISVGKGFQKEEEIPCKVGDKVLIQYYNEENVIKEGDNEYIFTDFYSILAVKES